jgi:dTDP-glucose pyrophosphorylase
MNRDLLIRQSVSIKTALQVLNKTAMKVLFVTDDERKLIGSLTDGDIRRAILKDFSLENSIEEVFNKKPAYLVEGNYLDSDIKELFLKQRIELIPIVGDRGEIIDIISWNDHFGEKKIDDYKGPSIGIPVIIMAGGKGTRLAPFTNVLPKPLIPIGEKTIIELIIDEFLKYGASKYILTLNYRGEMIRAYFEGLEHDYPVHYVREDDFYGTAGSLTLVSSWIENTFIVSNCDIIVKANYSDILNFHKRSKAMLTIVSSLQTHKIPYGVVDFKAGGVVTGIREKPEFTFPINTGVYFLEKECLDYIPRNTVFHMTNLIDALLNKGQLVVTYPISEAEYIDIGQWDQYHKVISEIMG